MLRRAARVCVAAGVGFGLGSAALSASSSSSSSSHPSSSPSSQSSPSSSSYSSFPPLLQRVIDAGLNLYMEGSGSGTSTNVRKVNRNGMGERVRRIEAGLLIPGRGAPIKDGVVIFGDAGRIIYAGPQANAPEDQGEARGGEQEGLVKRVPVVLPGLWDCHVHFLGLPNAPRGDMVDYIVKIPMHARAARGVAQAEKALAAGFTSLREVGGLADAIKPLIEEGEIAGPTLYYCGDILSTTGGHGDIHGMPLTCVHAQMLSPAGGGSLGYLCDGVPECLRAVRTQLRRGASCIKVCASGGVMSEIDHCEHQQFSGEELRAIVEEAGRAGRVVAAHCHGAAGISAALDAGCHTIEHGSFLTRDLARQMKKQGAILVPTRWIVEELVGFAATENVSLTAGGRGKGEKKNGEEGDEKKTKETKGKSRPPGLSEHAFRKGRSVYYRHAEAMRIAKEEGVTFALGTDMFLSAEWGRNGEELQLMADIAGLSPLECIEAATANGPLCLGPQAPLSGQLREGFDGDVIALSRNPLEEGVGVLGDPDNVILVVKGGVVAKD